MIELPRPRERVALAQDPAYAALRGEVLRFLYQKHANQEAATAG